VLRRGPVGRGRLREDLDRLPPQRGSLRGCRAPHVRGRGLGRALLDALERTAVELGCDVARLDSTAPLAEAMALYRSAGYVEIADYNRNPNATTWLERRLRQPRDVGTPW